MNQLQRNLESPWWKIPVPTRFFLAGLAVLSGACCVRPMLVDAIAYGLLLLADFRYWSWWFFPALTFVLAFSVRWFLIFAASVNGEMNEPRKRKAERFVMLSGGISFILFCGAVCERFGLLRDWDGAALTALFFGLTSLYVVFLRDRFIALFLYP